MRLVLFLALLAPFTASAQGTGTLAGTVFEADSVTTVIGANVRIEGTTLGAPTDIDGNFRILGVPVGTYVVTASYSGFQPRTVSDVEIEAGYTQNILFAFAEPELYSNDCCYYYFEQPLITNDAIGYSRILMGEDLESMPINR